MKVMGNPGVEERAVMVGFKMMKVVGVAMELSDEDWDRSWAAKKRSSDFKSRTPATFKRPTVKHETPRLLNRYGGCRDRRRMLTSILGLAHQIDMYCLIILDRYTKDAVLHNI